MAPYNSYLEIRNTKQKIEIKQLRNSTLKAFNGKPKPTMQGIIQKVDIIKGPKRSQNVM